jgi:hypothetical protein
MPNCIKSDEESVESDVFKTNLRASADSEQQVYVNA